MLKIIRVTLVFIWFFFTLIVVSIFSVFRPFHPGNGYLFCRIGPRLCVRLLGIQLVKMNLSRLTDSQPCVYIVNHQNILDVIILGAILPPNTVSIGKKAVRWIPFFGWLYWLSGHLLVERKDFTKAMGTMLVAREALLDKKLSIWFFVEGTRSEGRGLLPFKKGAFHLAVETGVPLQPIVASNYVGLLHLNKWHSGTVVVEALSPIATKSKTKEDVDALLEQAEKMFQSALKEPISSFIS